MQKLKALVDSVAAFKRAHNSTNDCSASNKLNSKNDENVFSGCTCVATVSHVAAKTMRNMGCGKIKKHLPAIVIR